MIHKGHEDRAVQPFHMQNFSTVMAISIRRSRKGRFAESTIIIDLAILPRAAK